MTGAVTLAGLLAGYRPESWGRGETWAQHAERLWRDDPAYMTALTRHMILAGWPGGPVITDDGVVQDGHHRIVAAAGLGWGLRPVPVRPAPRP